VSTDWTLAGCLGDPEQMFETGADAIALNRRVCAACPIRQECLQRALDLREPWGMWGGLTPAERERRLDPATSRRGTHRHRQPCGTPAAARRHQRLGEKCAVCRTADNPRQREAWPEQRERANQARIEARARARTEHPARREEVAA
jgi:hypothetical protein